MNNKTSRNGIGIESAIRTIPLILLLCTMACGLKSTGIQQDPREQELRMVLADADLLIRNLLSSVNSGSYPQYVKDFDNASRIMPAEKKFKKLDASLKKKIGLYEEGLYQVNKIEQYAGSYSIYYFVKFQKVAYQDPVIIALKIKRDGKKLKILDVSYRHALLETPE